MELATDGRPISRGGKPLSIAITTWWSSVKRSVHTAREQLFDSLRSLRFTVHALEGRTTRGHQLCVLYAGSASYRHYLRGLAFADGGCEYPLGRYWRWQLAGLGTKLGADVRVTRCARAVRCTLWPHARSFYVPDWLWSEVQLGSEAARQTGKRWSGIRRNRLVYTVTTDAAALHHFYDRMYVPLTKASHGAGAQLMRRDDMLSRVARGKAELISILQAGVAVGGCLVVYDNGGARIFSLGVLDADPELLRQRVGVAIYLYSFAYLFERGFRRVNLGRSRPFLDDGLLRFKLERGAVVTGATGNGIEIEPLKETAALRELLLAHPWVGEDADGLVATSFTDTGAGDPALAAPPGIAKRASVPISATLVRPRVTARSSCQ